MVTNKVTVTYKGAHIRGVLERGDFGGLFINPLHRSAIRLSEVFIDAARKQYMKHRITKETPSKIWDSFIYNTNVASTIKVTAVINAGGPTTIASSGVDYAIIVDRVGWKTRDGRKSPYKFMEKGAEVTDIEGPSIIKEEFGRLNK